MDGIRLTDRMVALTVGPKRSGKLGNSMILCAVALARISYQGHLGNGLPLHLKCSCSLQDAYGLYPPRRRGTGGHRESDTDRRTSPEDYCRFSPRKETST